MTQRAYNIAIVIPKYGLVGGAEGVAAQLTERLAQDRRFAFHVFAHRWERHSDRITFHRVPVIPFPKWLTTPSFAWFAQRAIRRTPIDLVHTHERIFQADLFTMHGVPHRFWVREVRRKGMSLFDRATARVEERLVGDPRCRAFLAVSSLAREIFLQEHPVDPARVQVLHPGVDVARYAGLDRAACRAGLATRFGVVPGERVILFVSMNFEVKGLDSLLAGLALLARESPVSPFRLLVVGKGDAAKYRELAASLGIGSRVIFTGVLPARELPALYGGADLYAMLSRFDTFGLVVLEAMAAGLPVLVSDRVGAKDLVQSGINGQVVSVGAGAREIAAALAPLLAEEAREKLGRAARATAHQYSWDRAARRVASLYAELLGLRPEED